MNKHLLLIAGIFMSCWVNLAFSQSVFINEIHYDNSGADSNEGVEIAGPAGTDLGEYNLVLYNGSNGSIYNTIALSSIIPDQLNGYGTVFFPISGLQNGSPDGIALDHLDSLVQFLSYEGSFTAVGGPADGLTSEDIVVTEISSTPLGTSLQLGGQGVVYGDFSWQPSDSTSYDMPNNSQIFGSVEDTLTHVFINEIHYDNTGADVSEGVEIAGPAGTDLAGWTIYLYNGNNAEVYNSISLSGMISDQQDGYGTIFFAITGIQNGSPDGLALVDPDTAVVQFLSYEGSFTAVGGPADSLTSEDIGVSEVSSTAIGFSLQLGGAGTVYEDFIWEAPQASTYDAINANQTFGEGGGGEDPVDSLTAVFINEIHYDNSGSDVNEGVELAGPAGTDLTGWSIVLYNGNGGASYNTVALNQTLADQQAGFGTVFIAISGLQNGSPDGIALVNDLGEVEQFLSYEGAFLGVGGPADGMMSEDILVSEISSTPIGFSLQLEGSGKVYEDFTWAAPASSTYDDVNNNQEFLGALPELAFINEIHYDNSGADTGEGVEIAGTAGTDLAGWTIELYNGNGGGLYNSIALSGVIADQQAGYGTIFFPISGIQNGSPDGVALINAVSEVVQFLSYEGTMVATSGTADSLTSEDIGVSESSGAAVGTSMQLTGNGTQYSDFEWLSGIPSTYDAINAGQTFGVADTTEGPEVLTIAEARASVFGTQVIVTGTLTASDQFGGPAFLQDATGGIAVFDSQLHGAGLFNIGDSVTITASVGAFNQQIQLVDITQLDTNGVALNPIVPENISVTALGAEEGKLVTISAVTITDPSGVFLPNTNYTLEDSLGNTGQLRVDGDIDLVGRTIPSGPITVTGVIGSFRGTPQLLPRFKEDVPAAGEYMPGGGISSDSTFDVATWNMEFFGSTLPNFGPSDVALQLANAIEVVGALEADIVAVQEVSDTTALQILADSLGYEIICSDRGSFSFDPDPSFPNQKLCYIYDPSTVSLIGDRAIFEDTYDSARAGLTNVLDGYPSSGGAQSFWASGRLPYLMTADVTILGVTERVNLVNIHGNSGAGDLDKRIIDFGALKDTLDTYYADETVIILGDYNDDVDESISGPGIASPYESLITDSANWKVTTEPLSLAGFKSFLNGSEMIDHIAISNEFFEEFIEGSESTFLPFNLVDNYVNTTSDHLPVTSRFEFSAIPVIPLSGEAICSDNPAIERNWVITNPNDFDVEVDFSYDSLFGSFTALPGVNGLQTAAGQGDLNISWLNESGLLQTIAIAGSDFPCVDSTAACFVETVVSFDQGTRKNGYPVSRYRSNPNKALDVMENRWFNFVSLGFGGEITLALNRPFIDQSGDDFVVVETTFGWKGLPCNWYPEHAEVFASKFGDEFVSLGTICRDGYVDLSDGGIDWAQYIKIVDVSNPGDFRPWADGYDVDGVICLDQQAGARTENSLVFNNEAPDEDIPFMVETYPNPVVGIASLNIYSMTEESVSIEIVDQSGKIVFARVVSVEFGTSKLDLDLSNLESGLYHLIARTGQEKFTTKLVKH